MQIKPCNHSNKENLNLMKSYSLKYLGWESSLKEFGDDYVSFWFMVSPKDMASFRLFIQYVKFKQYLERIRPDIFNLLIRIEKTNKVWGPNESVYVKELEGFGINLGEMVMAMVPIIFDIDNEIELNKRVKTYPHNFNKLLIEMEKSISVAEESNKVYYKLCNELEKTLGEKIIELYPVLINSSSEHIIRLKELIDKYIPVFANEISNLVCNAEGSS